MLSNQIEFTQLIAKRFTRGKTIHFVQYGQNVILGEQNILCTIILHMQTVFVGEAKHLLHTPHSTRDKYYDFI